MQSTTQNNLNQKTTVPAIKPEVTEFFQREINPNMTPEQIKNIIDSLDPELNPQPNPIQGQIVNLLYLKEGNNLAAIVIQEEDNTNQLHTLSAESDLVAEANTIGIDNLKDFQFRLQDAFNHDSSISIYYENDRIESLVIIKQKQEQSDQTIARVSSNFGVRPTKCHLPPNAC